MDHACLRSTVAWNAAHGSNPGRGARPSACRKEKELRFVANTGHTFGTAHPFEEPEFPKPFQELLDWTIGWFREYLR